MEPPLDPRSLQVGMLLGALIASIVWIGVIALLSGRNKGG